MQFFTNVELSEKTNAELRGILNDHGVHSGISKLRKSDLVSRIESIYAKEAFADFGSDVDPFEEHIEQSIQNERKGMFTSINFIINKVRNIFN